MIHNFCWSFIFETHISDIQIYEIKIKFRINIIVWANSVAFAQFAQFALIAVFQSLSFRQAYGIYMSRLFS